MLLCEEMGIDTGVDLDALIEVARMAEEIVGHQLPRSGSLDAFRRRAGTLKSGSGDQLFICSLHPPRA